jgi:multidrug efflux pump subunit AcrA (membrane-fusion protein)
MVTCLGCGDREPATGSAANLRIHRGSFVQQHLLTGEVEAVEVAEIKVPRTREHRLEIQWLIPDGSVVAVGDRVLEFDNSSFTANLDQLRTALHRSRRTLVQIRAQGEARLREAEVAVERARIGLAKADLDASVPESLRSRYEHRSAQMALSKARAQYEKAVADLRSTTASVVADNRVNEEKHRKAEREVRVAEEAVATLVLTAPKNGIVVVERNPWEDRKYQVGDTVFSGWTVVGIPDLDHLRIRASLSDVDDGLLQHGAAARCIPDIRPDLVLKGKITDITPIAREQRVYSERRGFDVTIDLDNTPGGMMLVPGMSVRVEIEMRSEDTMLIPRAAIDLSTSPPRVRQRDGSWSEVRIGQCSAQHCVLLDEYDGDEVLAAIRWSGS